MRSAANIDVISDTAGMHPGARYPNSVDDRLTSAPSRPLLSRRILFFGGKGGVGKTTVAAAFAFRAAREGHRTLLVSTDPAHSTSDVLEAHIGGDPTEVADGLAAIEIDPGTETERYIAGVKERIAETTPPRLVAEVERQIDIARLSPGAEEAALFDRFTQIIENRTPRFDRLIFDTAPTGHTLRLLTLPEIMASWTSGLISRREKVNLLGRMWRNVAGAAAGDDHRTTDPVLVALQDRKRRFEHARQVLTDPHQSVFVFVLVPERLPIYETRRAVTTLTKYHIPVGAVIVNRVIPQDADGVFMSKRREREATYLDEIARTFRDHPLVQLPLLPHDVAGLRSLEHLMLELPPLI